MSGEKITNPWRAISRISEGESFDDIEPLLNMGSANDPQWWHAAAGAQAATSGTEISLQYSKLESWSLTQGQRMDAANDRLKQSNTHKIGE